jgi:acyl-CoA synthetase (AMP-forming)/AMP-acid ligase II
MSEIRTLPDVLRCHAQQRSSSVAMLFEQRAWTYSDLDRGSNRLARALLRERLGPQARVAYLGKNTASYFELLFGVLKAGFTLVSVNWRFALPEVVDVLRDSQAQLLVVDREFAGLVDPLRDGALPALRKILVDEPCASHPSLQEWSVGQSDEDVAVVVDPASIAFQMYTSGTTGRPKGVQISHQALMFLRRTEQSLGGWATWTCDDVNLVCMPNFHIGGTAWGFIGFYAGGCNVVLRDAALPGVLAALAAERITRAFLVPALIKSILDEIELHHANVRSDITVYYGGAPMPSATLARALRLWPARFAQYYGMTESSGSITCLGPDEHRDPGNPRLRSCGKPLPGVDIRIVDGSRKSVPARTAGEIEIRSPSLMQGYWQQPEATAAVLREGWYGSGDVGYLDEEGYLYIQDRLKDMIVTGGENVYSVEVENALCANSAIAEAAVVGVPDERWGEAIKAFVVLRDGCTLSAADAVAGLAERIARYKIPKSIEFVATLPRNASGKILKGILRRPYWEGRERSVN